MKVGVFSEDITVWASYPKPDDGLAEVKKLDVNNDFFLCNAHSPDSLIRDIVPSDTNSLLEVYWFKDSTSLSKWFTDKDKPYARFDTTERNIFIDSIKNNTKYNGKYIGGYGFEGDIVDFTTKSRDTTDAKVSGANKDSLTFSGDTLRIKTHTWENSNDTTDGWYTAVMIYDDGGGNNGMCAYKKDFRIKYPTFGDMTVYLDGERDGIMCGGGQAGGNLKLINFPEKDKYGGDIDSINDYEHKWFYLSGELDNLRAPTGGGWDNTHLNITICDISQETEYYPLFATITHNGCPCPWNPDTVAIKKYMTNSSNDFNARINTIMKNDFLSSQNYSLVDTSIIKRRADSLFIPLTKRPLPRISFNLADRDGNFIEPIEFYNEETIKCGSDGEYKDSTFAHTLCPEDTLYLLLGNGDGRGYVPLDNTGRVLEDKDGNIPPLGASDSLYIITGLTDSTTYTVSATSTYGCTNVHKNLKVKVPKDAITLETNSPVCKGDTVKIKVKGAVDYTLGLTNENIEGGDINKEEVFKVPYSEFLRGLPETVTVTAQSKKQGGCAVSKTETITGAIINTEVTLILWNKKETLVKVLLLRLLVMQIVMSG